METKSIIETDIEENDKKIRRGVKYILKDEEDIPDLTEAFEEMDIYKIKTHRQPALIILSCFIQSIEDLKIIDYIKDNYPNTKIILISDQILEEVMIKSFEAGIQGYLLKKDDPQELRLAINKIICGENYICSEASYKILLKIKEDINFSEKNIPLECNLSGRELEILRLISEGLTNNKIAEKTFTSRRTVETHRKTLIEKTKTKNTAALIKYAMINKLIK
jgi:DNA-binding NarL/FixJ family response regulator